MSCCGCEPLEACKDCGAYKDADAVRNYRVILGKPRPWTDAEYEAETKRREEAKVEALWREDLRTAISYLNGGMGKSVMSITLPHRYCAALLRALEKAGVK